MQRILIFCEISQIVTGKNTNKSKKTKVNSPIVFSVLNDKTAPKLFQSLVRPTICLNLLVLSLIIYKCLHFFKIFAVFERIYKQNLQNY